MRGAVLGRSIPFTRSFQFGGTMRRSARLSLLCVYAAMLGGATAFTPFVIAAARAPDGAVTVSTAAASMPEWRGGFCLTPAKADHVPPLLRLAQTRTEVPPAGMKAVTPAPAFADSEPPLWDGLGRARHADLPDHDGKRGGAGLFRPGPAPRLRVQS